MKTPLFALFLLLGLCANAGAYILVDDVPGYIQKAWQHVMDFAKYAQQVVNQETQIQNQVTQITNEFTELERIGSPSTYINALGLADFIALSGTLSGGAGQSLTQIRSAADGDSALGYTCNGLYANLQGATDRFGNPVQYRTDDFRKFDAVNQSYAAYDESLQAYNRQSGSLQQQITTVLETLNSDGDLITSVKRLGHLIGLGAQVNASAHAANLSAARLSAQHAMNQNDAARVEQARKQREQQERDADLRQSAARWGQWIGGADSGPTSPVFLP